MIDQDLARLDKDLEAVRAEIEPLKWMNGIVIAGVLALIIKTFFADGMLRAGCVRDVER